MITIETARVPKPADSTAVSIVGDDEFDINAESEFMEFVPKVGIFGAPMCRWTTSVFSLIGMMVGMVFITTGVCILLFIIQEEPVYSSLGYTLSALGGILLFIGSIMWLSEFMCNDCLARCYYKIKSAPMKNAIKRRERLINSRATTRTGSRLSQSSVRTANTVSTTVSGSNRF